MAPPDAVAEYIAAQRRTTLSAVLMSRSLFDRLGFGSFDNTWETIGPKLNAVVSNAQTMAASRASAYVPSVLEELGITATSTARLIPTAFSGVGGSGGSLDTLLYQSVVGTRRRLGENQSLTDALGYGRRLLDSLVQQEVMDAGRAAESVEIAMRPDVGGYVRALTPPSCERCAVLAGRFYRWNSGFQRHPNCDCVHIPIGELNEDLTTDLLGSIRAGQVTHLSKADTRAILEDGADPYRVINAKKGMTTASQAGITVKTAKGGVRLRPESIYKLANDREHAIALLEKYGYIISP